MEAAALKPMLARLVRDLPDDDGWLFEPKWDGFPPLVARDGSGIDVRSRHGNPLGRYFPELIAPLTALSTDRFVLDGEVLVVRDGTFYFEALMARLHPAASRVRMLAAATPA